jgi:hypothetical protein
VAAAVLPTSTVTSDARVGSGQNAFAVIAGVLRHRDPEDGGTGLHEVGLQPVQACFEPRLLVVHRDNEVEDRRGLDAITGRTTAGRTTVSMGPSCLA